MSILSTSVDSVQDTQAIQGIYTLSQVLTSQFLSQSLPTVGSAASASGTIPGSTAGAGFDDSYGGTDSGGSVAGMGDEGDSAEREQERRDLADAAMWLVLNVSYGLAKAMVWLYVSTHKTCVYLS